MVVHSITVYPLIKPPYQKVEFIAGPGEVYTLKIPGEGCVYYYMGRKPVHHDKDKLSFIWPAILRAPVPTLYRDAGYYKLNSREYWEALIETGKLIDKAWPAWGYDPRKFFVEMKTKSGKTREEAEAWFNEAIAKVRSEPKLSSVEILEQKLSNRFDGPKVMLRLFGSPPVINSYLKNKPISEKARIVRGVFLYQFAERFGSTDFLLAEITLRFMLDDSYYKIPQKLRHAPIGLDQLERELLVLEELPWYAEQEFGFEMPIDLPTCDEDLIKIGFKELKIGLKE